MHDGKYCMGSSLQTAYILTTIPSFQVSLWMTSIFSRNDSKLQYTLQEDWQIPICFAQNLLQFNIVVDLGKLFLLIIHRQT